MTLGGHIGIGKGFLKALDGAEGFGNFQIFTGSPYAFKPKDIDEDEAKAFRAAVAKMGIERFTVHANYVNNTASIEPKNFYGSLGMLKRDIERSALLGATYFNYHLGSHKQQGVPAGIAQAKKGFAKLTEDNTTDVTILIENSAADGSKIGNTLEEIAAVLAEAKNEKVGITIDTCHAFAAGIVDWRDVQSTNTFFDQLEHIMGADKLKVVHLNDSIGDFGSHKDRHEHWGHGMIGEAGLHNFIAALKDRNLSPDLIFETDPEDRSGDFAIVRKLL